MLRRPLIGRIALFIAVAMLIRAPAVAAAPAAAPEGVRAQAREILSQMVAIDTSIGKGNGIKAAELLAARFRAGGFAAQDVQVLPVGDLASLVVRYRGSGKGGRPIALLAHLDVVAARREDWQRDPFQLAEEGGYFYGRGVLDIKGEVALLTATFLRLKAEGFVPTRDLIVAFSGDEETQGLTAKDLVLHHRDLVDAEFALNGDSWGGILDEATGERRIFYVQGAEKCSGKFLLTARNPGGHSSQPRADNAIYELADALKALQAYQFPVEWNDWTLGDFRVAGPLTGGELGRAMSRFAADPHDAAAAAQIARDPAFVGKLRTTCVATMLEGGHAENALPQSATATVNCRIFPGTSAAAVRATLQRVVGERIEVRQGDTPIESSPSPLRADVLKAVESAIAVANPGARVVPLQSSYATDGADFRNAGIPTYGVGTPFLKNSEVYAHGLNERIRVDEFYAGLTQWYTLIKLLAATP